VIAARGIVVARGGRRLLDRVDFAAAAGSFTGIVGPNGAGKSTLLRVLAGELAPDEGDVAFAGRDLAAIPPAEIARVRAVLPQQNALAFELDAIDVAELGRLAHPAGGDPRAAAARALAACGAAHLARRRYSTLSGGEQQRVQLARAIAQLDPCDGPPGPRALLLDEPTAALDIAQQRVVLALMRDLARSGHAVVAVLHDLNLAARWCDRVVVLAGGTVLADGTQDEALQPGVLGRAYGLAMARHAIQGGGVFLCPTNELA
jgi:iron complex transport system ATP-binding protein